MIFIKLLDIIKRELKSLSKIVAVQLQAYDNKILNSRASFMDYHDYGGEEGGGGSSESYPWLSCGLCVLGFTAGSVAACVAILVAFPEGSYSFCVEAIVMMEEGLMAHVFCESIGAC